MADDQSARSRDEWAPLVGRFVDEHYGSVRGRVRTYVIGEHLRMHLPPVPARIVDVGGGAGNQSVPLAARGYDVTIVDPSEAMLARAQARIDLVPSEVADRVTLVQATAAGAREALGGEQFDGVLCHGVIMYMDEPEPLVAALSELTAPGAVVSIAAKNAKVLAARHALAGDWEAALASFDSDRQINGLGIDSRADTVEHLSGVLHSHGIVPIDWYGVRLFTDGPAGASLAEGSEQAALAVELEASKRDPYRQMSRLFHLLARRPA